MILVRLRLPAVARAFFLVVAGHLAHHVERAERHAEADMVACGEVARLAAGAEGIHRRQWLLQRLWPHRHVAIMEMPSLPAEGLRFLPGTQDQLHALVGALARFLWVEVVGHHLVGGAAQHADDQPASASVSSIAISSASSTG